MWSVYALPRPFLALLAYIKSRDLIRITWKFDTVHVRKALRVRSSHIDINEVQHDQAPAKYTVPSIFLLESYVLVALFCYYVTLDCLFRPGYLSCG